jgi:UTP--glucose-1-phosphate uridylyltransferase
MSPSEHTDPTPFTSQQVTRAIIPCGGKGTRMLEITKGAPKELLPIADEPVLGHVLRECAQGGITDALIVISPGKDEIVRYAQPLAGQPRMPSRIEFVVQGEARGLADAIRLGREFSKGKPIAVVLPDNLFVQGTPAVAQVAETFMHTGKNVVGVTAISLSESANRGPTSVYPGRVVGDIFNIDRIPNKGAKGTTFDTQGADVAYTGVGRYVLTKEAFDTINEVERTLAPDEELDDIPVMQHLLQQGRLIGRVLRGRFLDVGLPQGYLEAVSSISFKR